MGEGVGGVKEGWWACLPTRPRTRHDTSAICCAAAKGICECLLRDPDDKHAVHEKMKSGAEQSGVQHGAFNSGIFRKGQQDGLPEKEGEKFYQ